MKAIRYGDIAVATTPLIASDMKQILDTATLTQRLKIGPTLRRMYQVGAILCTLKSAA